MKKLMIISLMLLSCTAIYAAKPKTNLEKLPEKERNEYLLKTAKEAVMKHGPDWYRDYRAPEIKSRIIETGPEKGKLIYSVTYFYDPQKEQMEMDYAIAVIIHADTGKVSSLKFGDSWGYIIPPQTRSDEKPYVRPCPYPKPN